MTQFSRYPLIYLTLSLILGILSYAYFPIQWPVSGLAFGLAFIILFGFHLKQKNQLKKLGILPLLIVLTAVLLGQIIAYNGSDQHNLKHYSHYIKATNILQIQPVQKIKSTADYDNYYALVTNINGLESSGRILLKIPKHKPQPKLGDYLSVLLSQEQLYALPKALNPYGFDYRSFMARRLIYHQINLRHAVYRILPVKGWYWFKWVSQLRGRLKHQFLKGRLSSEAYNLALAILLGQRQDLSPEIYQDFQATGTVHILAISGLHIGILLLFLNFIFKPVKNKSKLLYLILTLIFLWFYALLTGFSPSVLRAVIMFSFLQIGLQSQRQANIYNSLFAAALVMLLINPNYIYQVGFQMSFAAVLAIVSFYPVFSRWLRVKQGWMKWLLDLFWVSLSAQLGVLPLSLYYFHQFPTYFLGANLLVIPLLFLILFLGFSLMIMGLLHLDFPFLYQIFDALIKLLLNINRTIAAWPYSLIRHINFSFGMLMISLWGLFALYYFLKHTKKYASWIGLGIGLLFFEVFLVMQSYQRKQVDQFYVFHQYKVPVVAVNHAGRLTIYQDSLKLDPFLQKNVGAHFRSVRYRGLPFYQEFQSQQILHIDSLGIYHFHNFFPDIVALHYSPKINLERLIVTLHPKIIVVDGSDYPSFIRHWQKTAQTYQIRFYDVNTQGAFMLPQKNIENKSNSK